MSLEANDISSHRLDEKEKALMASFATTADALSLRPGSAEYDACLQEHRSAHEQRSKPDFGLVKEALQQRGQLTFISDPSWNSISRDLEGAKRCCGVDFERLIIALKSFYALNGASGQNWVLE